MLNTGEVPFFSCCIDRYCHTVDDQMSPRQLCMNCNCIAYLACSEALKTVIFSNLTFKILAGAKNGQKISAREIKMVDIHQLI